jgi:DNA (cytosine-5)-methyltransferase 1
MTGLSLCSGIGGMDLAFEAAGGYVTAMCERDEFCRKVLRKHWPDVPIFEDVKTLRGEDVGRVDVIYGGPPCQPYSVAGDQKGLEDDRHLWPEFSRLVGEIRPAWVLVENVFGILRIAGEVICKDLERCGYSVGVWCYEAAAVGALHRRMRVFFVAHTRCRVCEGDSIPRTFCREHEERTFADDKRSSSIFLDSGETLIETAFRDVSSSPSLQPKSRMDRMADGFPAWVDGSWEIDTSIPRTKGGVKDRGVRLKALGNAVVPLQVYPIFKFIASEVKNECASARLKSKLPRSPQRCKL